jgi:cyclopropane fatty-acyl-phospholipid synthase-like methyltransferase
MTKNNLAATAILLLISSHITVAETMAEMPAEHKMHMGQHKGHDDGAYHHSFADAEKWAKQFDNAERDSWQKPEQVLDALKLSANTTVADIGAGTGYFSSRIAKRVLQGKVFAVDAEPDMVQYLGQRAKREKIGNLNPIQASATSPNLPEAVDVVLLVDAYHHIGNRVEYFSKLRDSLKADGRLALIDFNKAGPGTPPKEHMVSIEQVNQELAAAGYKPVESHEFLPKQYFVVFQKSSEAQAAHGDMRMAGEHKMRFADAEKSAKHFDSADREAWQQPEKVLDELDLASDALVADIGAGTGYFSARIAKRVPEGKVFSADLEPDMVRYLGERAKRENLANIHPVQASFDSPNLPEAVDVLLFVNAYHLIENRVEYFSKLQPSLKDDGRLVIVDWRMNSSDTPPKMRLVAFDTAMAELKQAGYDLVETKEFLPRQYIAILQKKEK